jgi:L-histidine N-alpha-methyltransferase
MAAALPLRQLEAPAGIVVDRHLQARDPRRERAAIRAGLLRPLPQTDPKYFYDDRGSALFEDICALPEYYQTRTEHALLRRIAPALVAASGAADLVELGAGAALKTRALLDAMADAGTLLRYVPLDYSEWIVHRVAHELVGEYPGLRVHGVVADFVEQMGQLPPPLDTPRLVIFLGGTIGNFEPAAAAAFLRRLAARLRPGDYFLLGTDLVKDRRRLEAAYNDAAGVTAEFNKNVLQVLNAELGADFDPTAFDHRAFWDPERRWIEMRLVANRRAHVHLPALHLELGFVPGDALRTEISAKFDRPAVTALLASAGFRLLEWHTDPEQLFALSLARRTG